ncbi:O-antigen polymerase [Chryseobacterium sp. TY3]
MAKLYFFIVFIISLFVCILAPQDYDFEYSIFCAIAYWVNFILYLILKKKENYFDFDNLFFIAFFFVTLYYSAVMYESDPYRYIFYKLYFDKNTIPLASGIALLASSGYLFGAILVKENNKTFQLTNLIKIKTTWIFILTIILVALYVITGGYNALLNEYVGGVEVVEKNGASSYFYAFFPAFLFSGIIAEFYNLKIENQTKLVFSKINKFALFTTVLVFLLFFLAGSRSIPLQITIICVALYTLLYRPISFSKFILIILIGFIALAAVGFMRNALKSGLGNYDKKFQIEDSAMDLIVNNRNSYVIIDHVDKKGFSYGESMLSPLLAPIPFAQSLVISIFDLDEDNMRSALITTKDTFGEVGTWGLGTNIVGDVYLAFGILGIFILFPIMGYGVNNLRVKSYNSPIILLYYAILISYAVYLPRAEYFYFVRYFVWCSIILYLAIKLQKLKRIN